MGRKVGTTPLTAAIGATAACLRVNRRRRGPIQLDALVDVDAELSDVEPQLVADGVDLGGEGVELGSRFVEHLPHGLDRGVLMITNALVDVVREAVLQKVEDHTRFGREAIHGACSLPILETGLVGMMRKLQDRKGSDTRL